jgi:hypothetical protein
MLCANSRNQSQNCGSDIGGHVLGGVDAKPVEVSVGDPEAVGRGTEAAMAGDGHRVLLPQPNRTAGQSRVLSPPAMSPSAYSG